MLGVTEPTKARVWRLALVVLLLAGMANVGMDNLRRQQQIEGQFGFPPFDELVGGGGQS